jgi:predicted nucleotide-binding protein
MDKKEAIEFLKEALTEIPRLGKLPHDNQDFILWRNRVGTIIKYGLDDDDCDTFDSVRPLDFLDDIGVENIGQSLDYPKKLKDYEAALKSIIEKYKLLGFDTKPSTMTETPPKAFISHGKKSVALNKLEEFLGALGIEPLVIMEQPSLDKTIDEKVDYYLNQADFVVILATGDDKIENKLHPRQNVIHEVGLAQKTHAGKIIYLLEEGTEFPSNISPKVWEPFKQRNMMNAFLHIAKELRAYGMLKVVKP